MWQPPVRGGHRWFSQNSGGRRQKGVSELTVAWSESWLWSFKLLGQLALKEKKRLSYDWAPPQH